MKIRIAVGEGVDIQPHTVEQIANMSWDVSHCDPTPTTIDLRIGQNGSIIWTNRPAGGILGLGD